MIPNQRMHPLIHYTKSCQLSPKTFRVKISHTLQTVRPVVFGVVVQALAVADIAHSLSGATCKDQSCERIAHSPPTTLLCHGNQGIDRIIPEILYILAIQQSHWSLS